MALALAPVEWVAETGAECDGLHDVLTVAATVPVTLRVALVLERGDDAALEDTTAHNNGKL